MTNLVRKCIYDWNIFTIENYQINKYKSKMTFQLQMLRSYVNTTTIAILSHFSYKGHLL
jgi:hypothetical protein